jgi:acetyl-CoA synthetase
VLRPAKTYDGVRRTFRWDIPERYNIGFDAVDKHVAAGRGDQPALLYAGDSAELVRYAFRDIARKSNQLANLLLAHGIRRGDRVGILLPQRPETAIAHIAIYKLGVIAVPLFTLFGPDALEYRLADSGARALVTHMASLEKIASIRERLPELACLIVVDGGGSEAGPVVDLRQEIEAASDRFTPVDTMAEEPAVLIYTSGTTGPPKGALHAQRALLGHLPGVEMPHDFFPQPGDLFWTPADWAWIGGLFDVLLPAWHHGVPVLAYRFPKFDPEAAFALMARHAVRNVFLPPTALKLMRQVPRPTERHSFSLRSVGSGGETLGAELLDWGRETLSLTINEFYGQTECNLVVANCGAIMAPRAGSMGRPVPGHDVAILDEGGNILPAGVEGEIAIRGPDPVMFLGYWNNLEATAKKFSGEWLLTGDRGRRDEDGYLWFVGRADDVITSAGYRIGPGEVEDCLMKHPAVALAAAVGIPDAVRTEIVKAFVVLKPGHPPSDALAAQIQEFVKNRLAAHEYPRLVEFIEALPMTATGKIMRRELRQMSQWSRALGERHP